MRRSEKFGLAFNVVVLVTAVALSVYCRIFPPMAAGRYVTTLDREGVISEKRLREYDPNLASNLRNNLADYITQDHKEALFLLLVMLGAVSIVNFALFGFSIVRRNNHGFQ